MCGLLIFLSETAKQFYLVKMGQCFPVFEYVLKLYLPFSYQKCSLHFEFLNRSVCVMFFFCHVRICGGKNIKKSSLVGLIHDVNIPPYHMGSENKLKRLGGKILHSSLHHSYNNYNNSILLRKFLIKLVLLYFFNLAL